MPQKIIRLTGSNHKRITAVDITPDPDKPIVTIGGKNSAGKTSTMDLLPWAFGGKRALSSRPVRDGERKAEVMCETDDYVIERTVTRDGKTKDTVFAKEDGEQVKSPQALLSQLYSDFTFDALAFSRMAPRDQRSMLVKLAGVDLREFEADIAATKATVDQHNTAHDFAWKQLSGMERPEIKQGAELVSVAVLTDKLQKNQKFNAQIQANEHALKAGEEKLADLTIQSQALRLAIKEQQDENEQLAGSIATPADTSALTEDINTAAEFNSKVAAAQAYAKLKAKVDEYDKALDEAKDVWKEAKQVKVEALEQANFPIEGLGFDEGGVTFNSVPFDQLGSAEQLRVSVGMAMALNPELHVIRIMDGSLLDSDSMKIIEELAGEKDYQVWVEVVDEDGNAQVVIEDGMVA